MPGKKKKKNSLKNLMKKIKKNKIKFTLLEVIIIAIVSILLGSLVGSIIIYNKDKVTVTKVPSELDEFVKTYNNILTEYYKDVKKEKLVDAAIEGMVNSLGDPYSNYMNEEVTEAFNETVDGEYKGIGVTITVKDEYIEVVEVFESSPASKVLKAGDIITEIDGKDIKGKTPSYVSEKIKKKKKVKLKIIRDEKEKEVELTTASVELPSVSSKIIEQNNKKVGYIAIDVFAANTYKQFKKQLTKLENKKIDSLIIDVRNNSGGHLDQVTQILELFLGKDKILYQMQKQKTIKKVYSRTSEKRTYKIAVLINSGSASASEILASAIKESYNGEIIGVNSYGKGTAQNSYQLSDGTSLKYTTQKWLTPKGNWIEKKGVTPTKKVINEKDSDEDLQLQTAVDILTE